MKFPFCLAVAGWTMLAAQAVFCHAGPYVPAAGQPGSTAISKSDAAIVGWASGYQNYLVGANVDSKWQTPNLALGPAVGDSFDIVALGNGGTLTLTFGQAITDGPGWDFAVFENGVGDTFLELAYVEVSSNGADFFRFANDSLTPAPVSAFGATDPTNITGLAAKYRQGFGTPFDLATLDGVSPLLDVHHVGYVRVVDIIGNGTYLDTSGDVIYDPHLTTGSGGFDLEAVAVLHAVPEPSGLALAAIGAVSVWLAGRRRKKITCGGNRRELIHLSRFKETTSMKHVHVKWNLIGLLLAIACGWPGARAAAEVVDFDDLTLAKNEAIYGPFLNGYEEGDPFNGPLPVKVGTFTSGGVKFTNRHALSWGTATGFAYSNQTDNTTPGYGNQYSALTGTGHGPGDDNYGVAFGYDSDLDTSDPAQLEQLPHFELPSGSSLQSAYVTNTTYTALTIENGDDFGFTKPFGGDDGTDPDWYKLTVYATDATGSLLPNSVEFYLADYRSDDPNEHPIDTWQLVDLSSLTGAKSVYFNLSSSDSGANGMNTPGYFAIDDIQFAMVPEPASWLLLVLGAGLLTWARRRRR